MINLDRLYEYKPSFHFFAQQLMYPEKLDFHPTLLEQSFDLHDPTYGYVQTYWEQMHQYTMDEIKEIYTETFDFQKECALYMTYFKFEDAKERGQMLAKLKILYEMFGLQMPDEELPDYLPLMCEFLYAAEWKGDPNATENFKMLIMVLEDGTFHLLKALEQLESPYFHLVKALRETLKDCVEQEVHQ